MGDTAGIIIKDINFFYQKDSIHIKKIPGNNKH